MRAHGTPPPHLDEGVRRTRRPLRGRTPTSAALAPSSSPPASSSATLRGVFVPMAKVISASADLADVHSGESVPFSKCRKVFGLICHFCDALSLQHDVVRVVRRLPGGVLTYCSVIRVISGSLAAAQKLTVGGLGRKLREIILDGECQWMLSLLVL
jgi:hypothetical protein